MKYSECIDKVRNILREFAKNEEMYFEDDIEYGIYVKSLASEITLFILGNFSELERDDSENGIWVSREEQLNEPRPVECCKEG